MTAGSRFDGRTAIVTGAAPGIGRATALRLAADGASVGCLDMADTADTVAEITAAGGRAVAAQVNVADPDSVAAAVAVVEEAFGPVRILANVAGVLRFGITEESSVEDFDLQLAVNLKGPYLMARACIPSMLANGGGVITNVASTAGVFGQAYLAGYAASKGGVGHADQGPGVGVPEAGHPGERHRPRRRGHPHDHQGRLPRGHGLRPDHEVHGARQQDDRPVRARRAHRLL